MSDRDEREERNEYLFNPRRVPEDERSLASFRLLHELGSGGMATLFLATDELGRLVALKRLHRHLADDVSFMEMFQDEAQIARTISHPNVCQVRGLQQHQGELLIVMEYVHGESLAALQKQLRLSGDQLAIEAALHLVGQACLGLHAAHEQTDEHGRPLKIVHRDVSPHNLLVTYAGELKLVDFGIAKAVARIHHTETGAIKGKLAYMSPEQTRAGDIDRRSDIFCLGIVLYEAVCGRRCFGSETPIETIRRVQEVDYVPPSTARADLSPAVIAILSRAMAVRPEDRYQTAAEMYAEIYALVSESMSGVTTSSLGELMQRVFASRYAVREELRSLAFTAPEVLEDEDLGVVDDLPVTVLRCEYCGETRPSAAELESHQGNCAQRRWWEHNFGGRQQTSAYAGTDVVRPAIPEPEDRKSWWQRIRERLAPERRDPLLIRLGGIESRLGAVRDYQATQLSSRAMTALWQMVGAVSTGALSTDEKRAKARTDPVAGLVVRLKPRILRCANALLAITLEIEANANYLSSAGTRDLQTALGSLESRLERASTDAVRNELQRNVRRKKALMSEQQRVAERNELLLLRLESMVDAFELTLGKILKIASSPTFASAEANTQITVFLDSLVLGLDRLGDSLQEVDDMVR